MGEGALGARRRRTHPNYEKDKRAPVSKIETKDDDMDTGRVRISNRDKQVHTDADGLGKT